MHHPHPCILLPSPTLYVSLDWRHIALQTFHTLLRTIWAHEGPALIRRLSKLESLGLYHHVALNHV